MCLLIKKISSSDFLDETAVLLVFNVNKHLKVSWSVPAYIKSR